MSDNVLKKIKLWASAKKDAKQNPELLLQDYSGNVEECVRRMDKVQATEIELLALEGQKDLPAPLLRYISAVNDSGCRSCWVSSNLSVNHEDCNIKISEYFLAEEHLIDFGLSLTLPSSVSGSELI